MLSWRSSLLASSLWEASVCISDPSTLWWVTRWVNGWAGLKVIHTYRHIGPAVWFSLLLFHIVPFINIGAAEWTSFVRSSLLTIHRPHRHQIQNALIFVIAQHIVKCAVQFLLLGNWQNMDFQQTLKPGFAVSRSVPSLSGCDIRSLFRLLPHSTHILMGCFSFSFEGDTWPCAWERPGCASTCWSQWRHGCRRAPGKTTRANYPSAPPLYTSSLRYSS